MNEVTKIGVYTWLCGVLLYGVWDSVILLSHQAAGVPTYYLPLVEFGLGGLLAAKGLVLLAGLAVFPLCRSLSFPYADSMPAVLSAGIASTGLYLAVHRLLLSPAFGVFP